VPTWASQALSRRTSLKMRSFRIPSVSGQSPHGCLARSTAATCSWNIRGLMRVTDCQSSKSGTEDGTAFSTVAPSWRPGRRLLIECVDGTSMKPDRSTRPRLIRIGCWFRLLMLRLGRLVRLFQSERGGRVARERAARLLAQCHRLLAGSRPHLSSGQELASLGNSQQTLERGITILMTGATERCRRA